MLAKQRILSFFFFFFNELLYLTWMTLMNEALLSYRHFLQRHDWRGLFQLAIRCHNKFIEPQFFFSNFQDTFIKFARIICKGYVNFALIQETAKIKIICVIIMNTKCKQINFIASTNTWLLFKLGSFFTQFEMYKSACQSALASRCPDKSEKHF